MKDYLNYDFKKKESFPTFNFCILFIIICKRSKVAKPIDKIFIQDPKYRLWSSPVPLPFHLQLIKKYEPCDVPKLTITQL